MLGFGNFHRIYFIGGVLFVGLILTTSNGAGEEPAGVIGREDLSLQQLKEAGALRSRYLVEDTPGRGADQDN